MTNSEVLTPAPQSSDNPIFLATGGPIYLGTATHIGGGLFLGHNHARSATDTDYSKTMIFGRGLDGEQQVTVNAFYHFTQPDSIAATGENGGGEDIRLFVADNPNEYIPGIPLLVMNRPMDLFKMPSIVTRQAEPGTLDQGSVHYSVGAIEGSYRNDIYFSGDVVAGSSGAGLFFRIDTNGDGQKEAHILGTIAGYQTATSFSGRTYYDLADQLQELGINPDDLPRYTLMSAFERTNRENLHRVKGTWLNENLIGGSGHDTLKGRDGDDILTGGAGNDVFAFDVNDGHDVIKDFNIYEDFIFLNELQESTLHVENVAEGAKLIINGGASSVLFEGASRSEILREIDPNRIKIIKMYDGQRGFQLPEFVGEAMVFGNDDNNRIYGNSEGNTINGYQGDDVIDGKGGDDILNGQSGNDQLIGGDGRDDLKGSYGNDLLNGGAGNDLLDGQHGTDIVHGGDGADLLYGGHGNDRLYGGDHRDKLYGGAAADVLNGGLGNDVMYGEDGNDRMHGSYGDDVLDGGWDNDLMNGGIGNDILLGRQGDDRLYGSTGADELNGGHGNDFLVGGSGDDQLTGSRGDDVLAGGAGQDTFVFRAFDGRDRVTDFEQGEDLLMLQNRLYSDLEIIETESGTQIWYGSNAVVELSGFHGDLTIDDFIL